MRQRIKLLAVAAFAIAAMGILGAVLSTRVAISQEPQARYRPQSPAYAPPTVNLQDPPNGFFGLPQVYVEQSEKVRAENEKLRAESERLEKLLKELRNTDTSENKEQARQELAEMLSEQLDRDLQQREAGLAAIEERAKELRKHLELRRSSKEKTVEMLLMIAENPTAGLGIPEQWLRVLAPSNNSPQYQVPLVPSASPYSAPGARYYYPSTGGNFPGQPSSPMFHSIDESPQANDNEYRSPPIQNTRQ